VLEKGLKGAKNIVESAVTRVLGDGKSGGKDGWAVGRCGMSSESRAAGINSLTANTPVAIRTPVHLPGVRREQLLYSGPAYLRIASRQPLRNQVELPTKETNA
jgi:hypothetical protein